MFGSEGPMFSLTVLGEFQLRRSGQAVELPTRKLACLLTYLACKESSPQPRERLATLLWGSSNEQRARHNLRQAVAKLRLVLGPDTILNEGDALRLAPGVFDCDAITFDRLIREGSPTSIAAAVDLFGGALLDDIYIAEEAWDEWLQVERERLLERATGVMIRHGENLLASGNAEKAVSTGRRAVAFNRFREDAHRLIMKALAAAGRNSEMLAHYGELAAFLKSELMTEPDEKTRQIVSELGSKFPSSGKTEHAPPGPSLAVPAQGADLWQSHRHQLETRAGGLGEPPAPIGDTGLDASQRRQVTILLCSLVRTTQKAQAIDPEDLGDLDTAFRQATQEVALRFGGYIAPSAVDAVQIYFGYPKTAEFDAAQAVRAGIALVEAVKGMRDVAAAGMRARAGIATGLVVAPKQLAPNVTTQPFVIGDAPARADAMQALAAPGEVVVSNRTRPLLGAAFELQAIYGAAPSNATEQPEAWQVLAERRETQRIEALNRRMLAPIVGREEEIELLSRRWEQVQSGTGRVVLLSGEPGIGKSRIAEELLQRLDPEGRTSRQYYCLAHHSFRPLYPFLTQLEWSAGSWSAQSSFERAERLWSFIQENVVDPPRVMALVNELLMLPEDSRFPTPVGTPDQKRELVVSLYLEWIAALAAESPIAILFEDIHWIDPTSLDLLDRLIARVADLPVLLIVTMRPEHQPKWIGQPHVTMLHLNRLGRASSIQIIESLTSGKPLHKKMVQKIVKHADGIPLFVSELTKHLMESSRTLDAAEGNAPEGPQQGFDIPTTLQSSLVARLDQLGEIKQVALVGAAIGRNFSAALVAAILDMTPASLTAALESMAASGLITRKGTPPNAIYSFTHALVCDAAYRMMLKDSRRKLHAKIADALIADANAYPESSSDTVAHHLFEAGRTREAIDYWVNASRSAKKRWANRESIEFVKLALKALAGLPETPEHLQQAIDLHFEIKDALTPLGEFGQIFDHLRDAKALVEKLEDPTRLCLYHTHMCHSLMMSGQASAAIQFGEDAEALAASLGDAQLSVEAKVFLGTSLFTIMDYTKAEKLFLEVVALTDAAPSDQAFRLASVPQITARAFLTRINGVRGDFDQGISFGKDAMRRSAELQHPYSLCLATWGLADLYMTRGDINNAIPLFEEGLAVSRQWDLAVMVAGHSGSLGYARTLQGQPEEGLPLLEKAVSVFDTMHNQFALSLFLAPLAEACVLTGRLDTARDLANRALVLATEQGQRLGEAGALHILAAASAHAGDLGLALQYYNDALDLAARNQMRPLVARCHHGLSVVHQRMAELGTAQEHLEIAVRMYRDMGMPISPAQN